MKRERLIVQIPTALQRVHEQLRRDAEHQCQSSCTFRDDEHMTFNCELPNGHEGVHRNGDAEWTDETTWFK